MHCERDTEVVTLTGVMGWEQGTIGVRIYRDQTHLLNTTQVSILFIFSCPYSPLE